MGHFVRGMAGINSAHGLITILTVLNLSMITAIGEVGLGLTLYKDLFHTS